MLTTRPEGRQAPRSSRGSLARFALIGAAAALPLTSLGCVAFTRLGVPSAFSVLATRFTRPQEHALSSVTGIISLGGGFARTQEAVRLARAFPHTRLVLTGAGPRDYAFVRAQGFDTSRIVFEKQATTTFENATFSQQLIQSRPGETWLLVTSDWHMPRAVGAFRKAGIPVLAWPIGDASRASGPHKTHVAVHEGLGLLGYWVLGRSESLLPAPDPRTVTAQTLAGLRLATKGS